MTLCKPRRSFRLLLFVVPAILFLSPASAQRGGGNRDVDPHDVEAGSAKYSNICASCHGQDGDQVPGVDLGHDTFRRAKTDQELIDIIRNGIPGTGMPANRMSENAASAIVSYLHEMAKSSSTNNSKGDPLQGKDLFNKSGCPSCHRIGTEGSRFGPDLSDIGRYRRSVEIEQSIVDPSAAIAPQNRMVTVVTKDGTQVEGHLLNHDAFTVLLMDRKENLRSFDRAVLSSFRIETAKSIMPSYKRRLSAGEVADIVAFLARQKGPIAK